MEEEEWEMRAFEIVTSYTFSQKHLVICDTMAEAERIFEKRYPGAKIIQIKLDSEHVETKDANHRTE